MQKITKRSRLTILISDKLEIKRKIITRDKEHFIRIKRSVYQEDIIANIHHKIRLEQYYKPSEPNGY